MHFKTIILIATVAIAAFSCDKNDDKPSTPATPTNNPGTTQPTSFHGFLTTGEYRTDMGSMEITTLGARAYFSSKAVEAMYNNTAVKVSSVYLNLDSLKTFDYYYRNEAPVTNSAIRTWSVNGANGIPNFTASPEIHQPSYLLNSTLPATISKSTEFSVLINDVKHFTMGYVLIYDGNGSMTGNVNIPLKAGNNTIIFSTGSMKGLAEGNSMANISIVLENATSIAVGGKNFKFSRENQFVKHVTITP